MGKKKQRDLSDVAADFFGDDIDWLDDDDAGDVGAGRPDAPATEPSPALDDLIGSASVPPVPERATRPAPPLEPEGGEVIEALEAEADPHAPAPEAPAEATPAARPQIELTGPPAEQYSFTPEPAPVRERQTRRDARAEPPARTPPPAQVRLTPAPAAARAAAPPKVTPAPAPGRTARALGAVPVAAGAEPEAWHPTGEAAAWREIADLLAAEADRVEGDERCRLLFHAGEVHRTRLGDERGALAYHREAHAGGWRDPRLLAALVALARRGQRTTEALELLDERAAALTGVARADVLTEAAMLARDALSRPDLALERARAALEADPSCFAALTLLRDLLLDASGDHDLELAVVLGRLAEAGRGFVAAEARVEQARALRAAGDADAAAEALAQALEAWPGHAGALDEALSLHADRGDHEALADLCEAEAHRDGAADPGWWLLTAARARAASGQPDLAEALFRAAAADGYAVAIRELQAAQLVAGRHDALAASLRADRDASEGVARAFAAWRLGWHLEHALGDADGALAAYREAASLDPAARPAREDALRLLLAAGRRDEAPSVLGDGPLDRLRAAELAEADDPSAADAAWRAVAEASGGAEGAVSARLAWHARLRLAARGGRWDDVAALWLARADEADGAARLPLLRAAALGGRPARLDHTLELLRQALAVAPADAECVTWFEALCDDPVERADVLARAAEATDDPAERGAWLARAARLRADLGDVDGARATADAALEDLGHFGPALHLKVELSPPGAERAEALRRRAAAEADDDAAAWDLFASALHASLSTGRDEARGALRLVLERRPGHPGALAELERLCLAEGALAELADLYDDALSGAPSPAQARLALRLAELCHALDRRDEAVRVLADLALQDVDDRPLRAAARLAARLGAFDQASALLEPLGALDDRLERARIVAYELRQPKPALQWLEGLLEAHPDDLAVALHTARVAFLADDRAVMVRAYAAVAGALGPCPARAAYAAWTAALLEADQRRDEALESWLVALDARPDGVEAFDRVVRGLLRAQQPDALRRVFQRHAPDQRFELARALEAAGDEAGAAEVLAGAADLPSRLVREHLLFRLERWQELYGELVARRALCRDDAHREAVDARRRWLLVEKLADSDAAWDAYRALHEEDPDDVSVTEALARIASARGEPGLAIHYLEALYDRASDPAESARWRRRIGEVHERAGDRAAARQAFLDALDHVPDDADALDGLARLAREDGDWPGLISVLQREADLAGPSRQLEAKRDIARITEAHLGDPSVAMDAWRAVLERSPDDEEALAHLLELSERQGVWAEFVDVGSALANHRRGADRAALLRRVGEVCLDELGRDEGIGYLEQAVTGPAPDLEAGRRLEAIYRGRLDWDGVIRALEAQARGADTDAARAEALLRAAHVELEGRHDRDAAAVHHERVLELLPHHEASLRFMAAYLYENERHDEAFDVFERLEPLLLAEQDLDDFDTRIELSTLWASWADLLRRRGDPRALSRYERCLELNPTHLASLEAAGPLYVEARQWKKAERVVRQLLQLIGGHGDRRRLADTYAQLGRIERALNQGDKALKRFNKALELHQNHVEALKGMALVLEDREDWNNVLNVYNNVIYHATVPQDVIDAYMAKGRILDACMDRPDKAAQHYERTLEFDPDQPLAHLRLAELALRRGDFAEAEEHARKGLALRSPRVDEVRPWLLLCSVAALRGLGAPDEAQARWKELENLEHPVAIDLPPSGTDPEALRRVVELHLRA